MKHENELIERLNHSMKRQPGMPNFGRWLTTLDESDLFGLAMLATSKAENDRLKGIVQAFMSAEGLYRPKVKDEAKYIERLGEYALAEYAYRRDWAIIGTNPSLTQSPFGQIRITGFGMMILKAMGPGSKVASLLLGRSKINQDN